MSPRHIVVRQENCPAARDVLNRVGDKWSVLVVVLLSDGSKRFSELGRSIEGVSQRMLTLTLRGLERDGLVKRTVHPTVPPRVDYELTSLGRTLRQPIQALAKWAEKHRTAVQDARAQYDLRVKAESAKLKVQKQWSAQRNTQAVSGLGVT